MQVIRSFLEPFWDPNGKEFSRDLKSAAPVPRDPVPSVVATASSPSTNLAIRGDAEGIPSVTQILLDKTVGFSGVRVDSCRAADLFLRELQ